MSILFALCGAPFLLQHEHAGWAAGDPRILYGQL